MNKQIFQVPAIIGKIETMGGNSLRLKVDTQEGLSSEEIKRLFDLREKLGYFTFNIEIIEAQDIINLPKLDSSNYESGKTPGQRLRAVMFRIWEQKGKQGTFNDYYNNCMEVLVNTYKNKLE